MAIDDAGDDTQSAVPDLLLALKAWDQGSGASGTGLAVGLGYGGAMVCLV